jgi:hypothetical protein
MHVDGSAVGGGNPGALLPPVLEGKQSEKGQAAGLVAWYVDSDYPTLFPGVVEGVTELELS